MSLLKKIIALVVVVGVVGGIGALMVMDIPAPSSKVQKDIPTERFPG